MLDIAHWQAAIMCYVLLFFCFSHLFSLCKATMAAAFFTCWKSTTCAPPDGLLCSPLAVFVLTTDPRSHHMHARFG